MDSVIKNTKTLYRSFLAVLASVGVYTMITIESFWILFTHPPSWTLFREQLFNVGILSLPVVAITGFSTGLVLAAQSFFQLADKGLVSATGVMVGKSLMTELGPVFTAFIFTGRVGSAMCASIGIMQVTEQVDALRSMAINPIRYLVTPRLTAGVFMLPLLTVFSILAGILGGYLIATYFFGMPPITYFGAMQIYISKFDFISGLIKAFVFAFLICSICCYKGLMTRGGAEGVGRYTTSSVVVSYSAILIFNFIITMTLNLFKSGTLQWK